MPFEAPYESFAMEIKVGGKVVRRLPDLPFLLGDEADNALFLIADQMINDLSGTKPTPYPPRTPKNPWPILTGRSKGLSPFNTGGRGGFYVDNFSGDGWEIWNRTRYAQWVEEGKAGRSRRADGGRFIQKMWNASERRYFELAEQYWSEL